MEYHFCGCVRSDLDKIKSFVDNRIEDLNRYIIDDDRLFEIKLIVNELVLNGAIHGNELSYKKSVYLNIDYCEDTLFIRVEDEGRGINFSIDTYDPSQMLSGGRGLVLVTGLVDEIKMFDNIIIATINIK